MNDNDENQAYVDAMAERGTLLTIEQVEGSIAIVQAYITTGVVRGYGVTDDDINAIVAEAVFRWLTPRMGSAAIVGSLMGSIARMHFSREHPEPPEAA